MNIEIERLGDGPIITPNMDARMGDNINGPSLIEVPDWVANPLGRYYLYFAHHDGRYIRMAYADELAGPWTTHEAGVLPLEISLFEGHLASPDVHVDHATQQIRMYYHGSDTVTGGGAPQFSRVALSSDGLQFDARAEILGEPYMRVFEHGGWNYAISMPGIFYRSQDGLGGFEPGPTPFEPSMRHSAVLVSGERLLVFYTRIGDAPERILLKEIDLSQDWVDWTPGNLIEVLQPETEYEGGNLAIEPSARGIVPVRARQLRDPGVFQSDDGLYLLYSVAGEYGIALARMELEA